MGQNSWDIGVLLGGAILFVLLVGAALYGLLYLSDLTGMSLETQFGQSLTLPLIGALFVGSVVIIGLVFALYYSVSSGR